MEEAIKITGLICTFESFYCAACTLFCFQRIICGNPKCYTAAHENLISMHNQETADENLFFEQKEGAFLELYEFLGLDISFFEAAGQKFAAKCTAGTSAEESFVGAQYLNYCS